MTKTEAKRLAEQHLRLGWFHESARSAYVFCPRCRQRCDAAVVAWAKPVERVRALRDALIEHLTFEGDCDA